jgi:aspartate aminotransferase
MIRLAKRLKLINPSSTLAITSKAKKLRAEGRDIVSFGAGEPDFDTPDFIKKAAVDAINSGFTKYTPTTGIPELKKLICDKFKKDNSLEYLPSQVIVSCGAKHSIFNALFVLVNPNDEVLIPSPYWVSYPEMVRLCQAKPVFIKTSAKNSFKAEIKDIKRAITPKTKLLILNSPSNPTGCVYDREELEEIADLCVSKKIFVISDEIYEKIIFDGLKHVSIASLNPQIYDLTITVNGLSKSHSMTGWRIGYLGAPLDIAGAISNTQDHTTSNPCSISQKAAVSALSGADDFAAMMREKFQERRDYILSRIAQIKGIKAVRPSGAFYVFCDISGLKLSAMDFSNRLLDESGVAVIPGEGFGFPGHVRLSFATSIEQIKKGLDRIEEWGRNG